MSGGLLTRILILLQTPFVHHVIKQIHDRMQLIKIETLSKVIYGLLWAPWTLSHIPGPGMKAQFQDFLSQIVEMLHRISGTSLLSC